MNFFYIFAGIDPQLIKTCPLQERVRNFGIGFLVFLLSFLGLVSVSYACSKFIQINAKDTFFSLLFTYSLCLFLGLVWFLIVSNMYRACLTIAGIGDGTSKITKDEMVNAIPQFILLVFLGYCLSAPITVLLLNKDIVNIGSTIDIERLYVREKNLMKDKINEVDFSANQNQVHSAVNILQKAEYRELNRGQEVYIKKYSHSFITTLNKCYSQHLFLSLVILISSIFLYLIPLILRMMWVKGNYEHKVDFQNRLVLEKYGIYPDYYLVKYNGNDYYQDKFLTPEQLWRK